eukprot:TRINITY_DN2611_c0_g1_i4.p1 TRINITY_DN2611_c0_g1~~TRINITY_DN2611_c0_g1_i4.p1  ORF type:complete len:765 (+),score=201.71 TRINITY_DN2611_c0_g1_i4:41-2296(+)
MRAFVLMMPLTIVTLLMLTSDGRAQSDGGGEGVQATNITADGSLISYTTNDGNASGIFAISAAQVRSSLGSSPVAYVNVWVPSESFDEANPPLFLIQQNNIPIPVANNSNSNNNNASQPLNYFTKKTQGGSVTLMQLVVPLTPNQDTYIAVYFSYSLIPSNNNSSNSTNNSTIPINGGNSTNCNSTNPINCNSTNPINGGNSTSGNSTNPINGGNSTNCNSTNPINCNSTNPINGGNSTSGNSTNPINGGNSTNPINGGNSTNPSNCNSTDPINGGNSTNCNSTNPISSGNSTNTNSTMFKVGVTGPVSFNLSAWITSDRGIPLPTTQLNSAVGGSLKAGQFQYFNFNLSKTQDEALYVALNSNSPTAAGLRLYLSIDQYATLDNFEFETTFTKQFPNNYVSYAFLTDDQLPLSGHFSVLVYSELSTVDFTLTCLAPTESEVSVGVNTSWAIDQKSFSISVFELPPAVVQGPSPLVLSFDTPSAASAFNTKIYLAHERLATQYDFDYTLSTADNVNGSASSARYLILPDSELKSGSWFVAVYTSNGMATSVSLVVSLPGDASIDVSNTQDSPVTTEIGANLWGVFHFDPQSILNSSSSERFVQFSFVSSSTSKNSLMAFFSDDTATTNNYTVYGRYGSPPTPLAYDSISQQNDHDQVLCSDTNNLPKNQNGSLYYIAIVNQATTTLQFSISVSNEKECPSSHRKGKTAIVIVVLLVVIAAIGAVVYFVMRKKAKPVQVGQTDPDYRLLHHP